MIKRAFSGIQPTGVITIGNYLGAIKNWISMQNDHECLFCVVDLHSLTVNFNPNELRKNIRYNTALLMAAGIDLNKAVIFQQSQVKEHTELAWTLGCFTQIGWLNRMTQFKDKAGKKKETASLGLYSYPVLMAGDILLYDTDLVPVGEDQKQHIELTRDIAISFNSKFSQDIFKVPEPLIHKDVKRIMSLKNPQNKMSKSDMSDFSRINISDDKDLIAKKILKAKTDNIAGISYDPDKRPEIANLLNIYSGVVKKPMSEIIQQCQAMSNLEFKEMLIEALISVIEPIQSKLVDILSDKDLIDKALCMGKEKAQSIACNKMEEISELIGIK